MMVGDLVEPISDIRRQNRGVGVVLEVIKKKFKPTRVLISFPSAKNWQRRRRFTMLAKDVRIVSESR